MYAEIDNAKSSVRNLNTGVPQGSIPFRSTEHYAFYG